MAALEEENVGTHTLHMRAAYAELTAAYDEHQQLKRDYAAALREIEELRADVRRLQSGIGIVVEIDGKKFTLDSGLVTPEPQIVNITPEWLLDQTPRKPDQTALTDSFVLSKD